MWPDRRILDLLGIELPIIQAPMAGSVFGDMAIEVANAGGLGSLPCATLSEAQIREELKLIRSKTSKPVNLNFFCHQAFDADAERERQWRARLEPYYEQFQIDRDAIPASSRAPFDAAMAELVREHAPEVVSFHFGLPSPALLDIVKASGAKVLSSATSVQEAVWLEQHGCDAVIAQGLEAGGHRGMFLSDDIATQVGTMALVPQIVDAVSVPVIASGGITDARGIVAAFALGASAVQLGTAYLFCPEARLTTAYRAALRGAGDTALTNIFTGRPARGIVNRVMREVGPMSTLAPRFPLAGGALLPLKAAAEKDGSGDFTSLWSGQAARLGVELPAGELTRHLARQALQRLAGASR